MKAIHKNRLLKLARHLRTGKLGHKKFDFSVINADEFKTELSSNGCGALGCAVGECPFAFPRLWTFQKGQPNLKNKPKGKGYFLPSFEAAKEFFGLDKDELNHLFIPLMQNSKLYGGLKLHATATAKEVAANIEAFVKHKKKESK